jgi:hypothetical protein
MPVLKNRQKAKLVQAITGYSYYLFIYVFFALKF